MAIIRWPWNACSHRIRAAGWFLFTDWDSYQNMRTRKSISKLKIEPTFRLSCTVQHILLRERFVSRDFYRFDSTFLREMSIFLRCRSMNRLFVWLFSLCVAELLFSLSFPLQFEMGLLTRLFVQMVDWLLRIIFAGAHVAQYSTRGTQEIIQYFGLNV